MARVTEARATAPGMTLDEVEEWGARVRSALFVARGTLETERERIVAEANALGTAVLGESLGRSSVAVVRRRLEESLGRGSKRRPRGTPPAARAVGELGAV